jgi:large subunit ribosomal protein L13
MKFTKQDLNRTLYVPQQVLQTTRAVYLYDASQYTLGRLATIIADHLLGKNKAHYCDFWDCGDVVAVKNVTKFHVTANKATTKIYHSYSGWKGNIKSMNLTELMAKHPEKALWFAVKGMLPKNKLRDKRLKRLKLFAANTTSYDTMPHVITVSK